MAVQSALNLILPMKSPEDLQEVARVSPVRSAAASDSVTASTGGDRASNNALHPVQAMPHARAVRHGSRRGPSPGEREARRINGAESRRTGEQHELGAVRRIYDHDTDAPTAGVVVPSVFVAVRDDQGRLLMVRRHDSGAWELPGGRVDVGESAVGAAVRETTEECGLQVRITGLVGLFTDPGHIVVSAGGDQIRQQFVVCFHAWLRAGTPRPDHQETSDAAWFDPDDVAALPLEPGACRLIRHALSGAREPISTEERMAMKTLLGPWE